MAVTKTVAKNSQLKHRAEQNRLIRQEEMRNKFKGAEYIRQLEDIASQYDDIIKALDVAVTRRKNLTKLQRELIMITNLQIDIIKTKLDALKLKADLNFRRLKFILPELKAIEWTDPETGKNPLNGLTELFKKVMAEGPEEE